MTLNRCWDLLDHRNIDFMRHETYCLMLALEHVKKEGTLQTLFEGSIGIPKNNPVSDTFDEIVMEKRFSLLVTIALMVN